MTPQERRAKYPLPDTWQPLSADEIEKLRARTQLWLDAPTMTSRHLDHRYALVSRLLATIDELRRDRQLLADVIDGVRD